MVHKPYRNEPSKMQVFLEIICFFIILGAGVLWLGGAMAIFLTVYVVALGILGLFAWTRRHVLYFILWDLAVIAALIVNIILMAVNKARKVPWDGTDEHYYFGNFYKTQGFVGSAILLFITAGILLFLCALALLPAIKLLFEHRSHKVHHKEAVVEERRYGHTVETRYPPTSRAV